MSLASLKDTNQSKTTVNGKFSLTLRNGSLGMSTSKNDLDIPQGRRKGR